MPPCVPILGACHYCFEDIKNSTINDSVSHFSGGSTIELLAQNAIIIVKNFYVPTVQAKNTIIREVYLMDYKFYLSDARDRAHRNRDAANHHTKFSRREDNSHVR